MYFSTTQDIKIERFKVRIFGYHEIECGEPELADKDLPWAQVMYPVTAGGGGGGASSSSDSSGTATTTTATITTTTTTTTTTIITTTTTRAHLFSKAFSKCLRAPVLGGVSKKPQ